VSQKGKPKPSRGRKRRADPAPAPDAPTPSEDVAPRRKDSSPSLAAQWTALGTELAAWPHRLALALHVARATTSGGGRLTPHEEDALAQWFGGIIDEGIRRSGGVQTGLDHRRGTDNPFCRAAWYVLHTDWHRHPLRIRPPRCPAMATVPGPGDPGFVDAFRAAAPGYLRTVIAGASDHNVEELALLLTLGERALDEQFRPFGAVYTEEVPLQHMERALEQLSRRYYTSEDICDGVEAWASAFDALVVAHDIPPVKRIGAVVWLACVGLHADGAS
jgi:hypothetical protein